MPKYCTAQQFLLAEDSIPGLLAMPRSALVRTIERAEILIDAYVGFDARYGGFEPHTAWYQYEFDESTRRVRIPNFPVPARLVDQYRVQVANQANGQPYVATISTNDAVINQTAGYIEIIPLQSITWSVAPFLAGMGLRPPLALVDYEAGFYLAAWGEVLNNWNNDGQTFRAQRGYWATSYNLAAHLQPQKAPAIPPVVYVNNGSGPVVQATNTYTLDTTEGVVTFNAPVSGTVTADYCYQIPDAVRDATIAQTTNMLHQRNLNLMGLGGLEVARTRDQQIKRHIRTSADSSSKDEPAIDTLAMQLLEPYTYIPGA